MVVARPEPARQAAAPKQAPPVPAPPARFGGAAPATGSLAGPMAQLPPAGAVEIVGGAPLALPQSVQTALNADSEVEVPAVFGALAGGPLRLHKKDKSFGTKDSQSLRLNVPFLDRLRGAAVEPVLAVQVTDGVVAAKAALKVGGKLLDDPNEFLRPLRKHAAVLGWNGLDKLALDGLVNKVEGRTLTVGIATVGFGIGGFLTASGSLTLVNGAVDLAVTATGTVPGIGSITAPIRLTPEGLLVIQAKADVAVKGFTGQLDVMYANGLLDVQGTVAYRNDRMDGSVTLVVTDKASAKALTDSHLPGQAPPLADGAAPVPPAAAPPELAVPQPKPGPRVVAGWGKVNVRLADWLTGEAMVVVDHLGDITIVGKMTPRMDKPLFKEKDYIHAFPKLEIRAVYGVPVVGNVFLFANIGVEAIAKIGPATLDRMEMTGTWSTKPDVLQNFGLTGTLNISAFAGIRVNAEGGAGLTILDHDIKAGVALSALAGIRGYVDATPRIGYRELADPKAGKRGEFFLGGHLDIAAQPFLQLGGEMFVELDSPWWSPAPDKRWPWPLGTLEYPLPGEFGIGADIEHVIGSGKFPEIKFAPVNFDSQRFMTDLVSDHVPPKKSTGDKKKGTWKETPDGTAPAVAAGMPPPTDKGAGKGEPVRTPAKQKLWTDGVAAVSRLLAKKPVAMNKSQIDSALAPIRKDKGFSALEAREANGKWAIYGAMSKKEEIGTAEKAAETAEPENEPPTKGCVLVATIRFAGPASRALRQAIGSQQFQQMIIPKAREGDVSGPSGKQQAMQVGLPPGTQSQRGVFLLDPGETSPTAKVVSFNSGDPRRLSNESHAERFFMEWFRDEKFTGLEEVAIDINWSPCSICVDYVMDITRDVARTRRLTYSLPYEGYDRKKTNIYLQNSTTSDDLKKLERRGWVVAGPPLRFTDRGKEEEIRVGKLRHSESR